MQVDRRENTTFHRHEVRRKDDGRLAAAHIRVQDAFDLDHVPMLSDVVGLEVFIALGEMVLRLGLASGATDAAGGIHNDLAGIDQPGLQEGEYPQRRRGRVAPGVGHDLGRPGFLAVQFRKSVDRVGQVVEVGVDLVVPLLVFRRFLESVVRREVDYPDPRFEQGGHEVHRQPVRQA